MGWADMERAREEITLLRKLLHEACAYLKRTGVGEQTAQLILHRLKQFDKERMDG